MAKFMNVQEDSKDVNEEEFANLNEEEEQIQEEEVVDSNEQPSTPEDDIPDKYKGKSMSDIVQMHQEAEKLLGRHSSEVGELRKIVDDFIRTNLNKEESPNESEQEEDFWADPKASIDKLVSNHPSVKKAEETNKQLTMQEVRNRLNTHYPDWEQTVQSEDFTDWVRKSKSRMQKYADAENNFDWDAADDLLGTWADLQKAKQATNKIADADVKAQRKAASTGNAKASDSAPSRKIYKRSDIINLYKTDKKRYMQLADEIQKAYAEGRVR